MNSAEEIDIAVRLTNEGIEVACPLHATPHRLAFALTFTVLHAHTCDYLDAVLHLNTTAERTRAAQTLVKEQSSNQSKQFKTKAYYERRNPSVEASTTEIIVLHPLLGRRRRPRIWRTVGDSSRAL